VRYYDIILSKDDGTVLKRYRSQKSDGSPDGGALKVEFDIPVYAYGIPAGGAHIKVSGVNFADIQQSSDFATSNSTPGNPRGANIILLGGMGKGLPLANPAQAGLLLSGQVQQCWGNWQGTETSLELVSFAKPYTRTQPANLSFNWQKGQTLQDAVTATLTTAYPGSTITGGFTSTLVYTEDQPGFYQTLEQFSAYVLAASQSIIQTDGYIGAQIRPTPAGFELFDGSTLKAPKAISFLDLMGQPTWIDVATLQVRLVLRADLNVNDIITLPTGTNAVNTQNNYAQNRNRSSFQGTFMVKNIRHLGDSRQPSGDSWLTIIECVTQLPPITP